MKSLENRIPPPLVMVITGFVMWALSPLGFTFEINDMLRKVLVLSLVLTGFVFGIGGALSFKSAKTTVNPLSPEKASSLVISGVYKITRNPMYVGLTSFLMAWGLQLQSFIALLFIPLFILYMTRLQIVPEERALEAIFGEDFTRYKASVRRWI